jgi:hypothetical protein
MTWRALSTWPVLSCMTSYDVVRIVHQVSPRHQPHVPSLVLLSYMKSYDVARIVQLALREGATQSGPHAAAQFRR